MSKTTKAFQENLSILFDELNLAKQWGKASIIFTIHKSTLSQEKTKKAIQKELRKIEYSIIEIEINKVEGNFIDFMLQQENIQNIVFFISNINWGGGKDEKDGYRTLNLYREIFIEKNIKAIFFLTLTEASKLPGYAPDFWAFRHLTLWFGSPHLRNQKQPPAGLLQWHNYNSIQPIVNIKSKIVTLTKLLKGLPDRLESVSMRIDLNYELGYLYWRSGEYTDAEKSLGNGIATAKNFQLSEPLVKLHNGLAIINYEQQKHQSALDILDSSIKEASQDAILFLNQAVILFAMKKGYAAIMKGEKAISLDDKNPWLWNSLGFLYYFAGKLDSAETCFQKAIDISPNSGYFLESLAICYLKNGLRSKARTQLQKAYKKSDAQKEFQGILNACVENHTEKALLLIEARLDNRKISKTDMYHHPILNALIDSKVIPLVDL